MYKSSSIVATGIIVMMTLSACGLIKEDPRVTARRAALEQQIAKGNAMEAERNRVIELRGKARAGDYAATVEIAEHFRTKGWRHYQPRDQEWLCKAAEGGRADFINSCVTYGRETITTPQRAQWLMQEVQNGDVKATENLTLIYMNGNDVIKADHNKAVAMYNRYLEITKEKRGVTDPRFTGLGKAFSRYTYTRNGKEEFERRSRLPKRVGTFVCTWDGYIGTVERAEGPRIQVANSRVSSQYRDYSYSLFGGEFKRVNASPNVSLEWQDSSKWAECDFDN